MRCPRSSASPPWCQRSLVLFGYLFFAETTSRPTCGLFAEALRGPFSPHIPILVDLVHLDFCSDPVMLNLTEH